MRIFLKCFLLTISVSGLCLLILLAFSWSIQPSSPEKIDQLTGVFFGAVVCAAASLIMWDSIKKDLLIRRVVREVVGIMPDQIDEWKWREYASVKLEDRLRVVAMRIKDLDKEEKELLRRVSAPTEKVLEANKRIKEALREFRQVHDVFQNSFDFKLKDSWNNYASWD